MRSPGTGLVVLVLCLVVALGCDNDEVDSEAEADGGVDAATEDAAPADADADGGHPDASVDAGRHGFIVIHCDPHEMLQLHGNLTEREHDYDGNGTVQPLDMWLALMDLVDLADAHGHHLTLQLTPPYVEHIGSATCDAMLAEPREYPSGGGTPYTSCRDLVFGWQAAGHELSIHHHGPHHDATKFDGYTNLPVWDTNGRRPCLADDAPCECRNGACYWCAPPESDQICQRGEDPPSPIGVDPEWRGTVEGPDGMWTLVQRVLGEGTVTSICMNHGDEVSDMPMDPSVLYTTQGGGYDNPPDTHPMCVAYDLDRQYHESPRYTWFYRHAPVSNQSHLEGVRTLVDEMGPQGDGRVLGIVFHVNDFARSRLAADGTPSARVHEDLFAFLADPDQDGNTDDQVRIGTLTGLLAESGKTSAPDPCSDTCFTLDTNSESADYTIPAPRPLECE